MSKIQELEALVASLRAEVETAKAAIQTVVVVEKTGKKAEALQLLLKHPRLLTKKFSSAMNISDKNMQSVVCYLRADGWNIPKVLGVYELHVNDMLLKYAASHKVEQFMQDRIDEYNAVLAYRASKQA